PARPHSQRPVRQLRRPNQIAATTNRGQHLLRRRKTFRVTSGRITSLLPGSSNFQPLPPIGSVHRHEPNAVGDNNPVGSFVGDLNLPAAPRLESKLSQKQGLLAIRKPFPLIDRHSLFTVRMPNRYRNVGRTVPRRGKIEPNIIIPAFGKLRLV